MRLRWSRRAVLDLVEIGDYIVADDPVAARRWGEKLRLKAARAAAAPAAGRRVPELGRDDVREVFLRSYRIVYRIVTGAIVVLTIVEGHRRLPAIDPDRGP